MQKAQLEREMNVSRVLESILDRGNEATFDIGHYRITITPKFSPRTSVQSRTREDARLWKKIEPTLRAVRAQRTRAKYPWLYD